MTAPSTGSTEVTAPAPFNALLAQMHGRTSCLASTMSTLAPFLPVAALPDATVLDLHLSLSRSVPRRSAPNRSIDAHAKARYATQASATEATDFYERELRAQSMTVTSPESGPDGAVAHFDATATAGRYCARVFDLHPGTTVMVQSQSTHPPAGIAFAELANWHQLGDFEGATADQVDVFTVAAGRQAPIQAIYSTEYDFPGSTTQAVRTAVDALLQRQGWAATEMFENSLLFDAAFEGEAHIAGHDGGAARLTIVGEYSLTTPTRGRFPFRTNDR